MKINKFSSYKLSTQLLKSLDLLGYHEATEVQQQVIPVVLDKKDIIVKSQTGSGKTAAFVIPICEAIDWEQNEPQVIVLTPTRELALQVSEDVFNIGRFKRIKVVTVFGKSPIKSQIKDLKQKTHFVVGTPGRVIDLIKRGDLDLSKIKYLVLDEADEMLNMGFIEQIHTIVKSTPTSRITTLFSATIPKDIEYICRDYMKSPKLVEIESNSNVGDRIDQVVYYVGQNDKLDLLKDMSVKYNPDSCIVFCNTRVEVENVYTELDKSGYTCNRIHGGMEQEDRTRVMKDFKKGYFRYLIATDVAARGIDVDNISLVVNFDVPEESESYVHRIGRTGRKELHGHAITFVSQREKRYLHAIESILDRKLPTEEKPEKKVITPLIDAFNEKMASRPTLKKDKGHALSEGILKLHINAGKKTKMRPTDIVGTLCNLNGMTSDDIGIISITDVSTFFEILNGKGEDVYQQLQNTPIKGRLRKVSKANE